MAGAVGGSERRRGGRRQVGSRPRPSRGADPPGRGAACDPPAGRGSRRPRHRAGAWRGGPAT